MDDIAGLLGLGLDDEESMAAMADSLRGKRRGGNFMSRSSIPQIADRGRSAIEESLSDARAIGETREARRLAKAKAAAGGGPATMKVTGHHQIYDQESKQLVPVGYSGPNRVYVGGPNTGQVLSERHNALPQVAGPASVNADVADTVGALNTAMTLATKINTVLEDLSASSTDKAGRPVLLGDIKGYGDLSGGSGPVADFAKLLERMLDDSGDPSRAIGPGVAGIAGDYMRQYAGLSQTRGEAQRVIEMLGQKAAYTPAERYEILRDFQRAVYADMEGIRRTNSDYIQDQVYSRYNEGETNKLDEFMALRDRPLTAYYSEDAENYQKAMADYMQKQQAALEEQGLPTQLVGLDDAQLANSADLFDIFPVTGDSPEGPPMALYPESRAVWLEKRKRILKAKGKRHRGPQGVM